MKSKQLRIMMLSIVILTMILIIGCDQREEDGIDIASITISPRTLIADNDETTYSTITARVEDSAGYPAEGVSVNFEAIGGYLFPTKVNTDESGIATTNFYDVGEVGIAIVSAYAAGEENKAISDTLEIVVDPQQDCEITSVTYSPSTINADNDNTTYSELSVMVEDSDGYPASDIAVAFSTDLGTITSTVNTDDNGIALNQLYDTGISGMAHITIYIEENMEATTWMDSLEIKDDPSATNLITFMGAAPNFLYSDDDNTTYSEVTVNVENGEGYPAENVPVTFTTNLGNITSTINTDSNGQAINMFYDNGVAGLADITATIPGGSSASKTIAIIDHPDTESSITPIMLLALTSFSSKTILIFESN